MGTSYQSGYWGWRRTARARSALVALFAFCLLAVVGRAATFTASLDRDRITMGERATLSLSIDGGSLQSEPTPPEVLNLQIVYIGPESKFSVINGQVSSSVTYHYTLVPRQPGDYTLPAITIDVGGEKLSSQPLTLKVSKASAPSPDAINAGTQLAFLKLVLPKKQVYVGETFTAQLQLYVINNARIGGFQLTPITADGFNVGKMAEGQRRAVQVGNGAYTIIPLHLVLTAIKAGSFTLGPVTATMVLELPTNNRQRDAFDPFGMFNRTEQRQVPLATEAEAVQSLPVPREGAPADFTGAVGSYTMTMTAGPTNVAAGDPITVRIQISGRGSLDSLTLSDQPGWHDFKAYPPTTKVETSDPLGIQGTKTFEQLITPQNADIKAIPPVSFSFFDPDEKKYRTLMQPAVPLTVRPGGSAPVPTVAGVSRGTGQDNTPPTQDIVPIKQHLGVVGQANVPLVQQPWFVALQGVPLLAFVSAAFWRKRTDNLANNPRLRRRRQVARIVREGLQQLRPLAQENKSDEFFATVFRLLQEQLGERLDAPASSITEAVIEERLRPAGVAQPVLAKLQELFQTCNLARYAPVKSSQELAAIVPKVERVLGELQKD